MKFLYSSTHLIWEDGIQTQGKYIVYGLGDIPTSELHQNRVFDTDSM